MCPKGDFFYYFFITYQAKVFGSREYIAHVLDLAVHNTETGYSDLYFLNFYGPEALLDTPRHSKTFPNTT